MELTLSALTLLYTDFYLDTLEMVITASKKIAKVLLFLVSCLVIPVTRLRALGKKKQCPPIRNKILFLTATELAGRIRRKEISSEEVVSAYIARCKEVNPILNAIVDEDFDRALRQARQVDAFLKTCAKTEEELARNVPLLGLPVTVKESLGVQGLSHSVGVKEQPVVRADRDAEVVTLVRKAGGIPILVSNTPEMCMFWETYNNVTGITWNPYDTKRTAGGSSGGEGALLGSGASLLSLSSDIGGSARLPAMFCGIFGHKPSPGWISSEGHKPGCSDKNWNVFFTIGPMVRYVEDLPLLLKVLCQVPTSVHRLDEQVSLGKMKFAYVDDNPGCSISSPVDQEIKDAIHRLVRHIETHHGVKAQKVHISDMKFSLEVSALNLLKLMDVETIYNKKDNPEEWKSVFVEVLKYVCFVSHHTMPNIIYGVLKPLIDMVPEAYCERAKRRLNSLKKQFEDVIGDNGVLIYPSFPSAAHYPYEILYQPANVSYFMIFNALGFPVTQCPLGLNKNGLPIGVQIVGRPGNDRLTIAVAKEIQKAFGGWQPPSCNEKTV